MTNEIVKILKALSDETRVSVVTEIAKHKEISCAQLQKLFDLSQPTLSHHFNKLVDADIVLVRKEGTSHYYSINHAKLDAVGIHIHKWI